MWHFKKDRRNRRPFIINIEKDVKKSTDHAIRFVLPADLETHWTDDKEISLKLIVHCFNEFKTASKTFEQCYYRKECIKDGPVDIEFIGPLLDVGILQNIILLKNTMPGLNIKISLKKCGATTKENRDAALTILKNLDVEITD